MTRTSTEEAEPTYPPFGVAVDLVILTVRDEELVVLAIERGVEPFRGRLALPGGFVRIDEDLRVAAQRELMEETGVAMRHLEQLATYGRPDRDPRMRVVSVAYLAFLADLPGPVAGSDAAGATWLPVEEALRNRLAFDHAQILRDGIERSRAKLEYTTLATAFCRKEFTIGELRRVYEIVWDEELDPRNFHRKVVATEGFVIASKRTTTRAGGRPARLYRAGKAAELFPPFRRPTAG